MVEHDLAKVGVEGSNPFARSKNSFSPSHFLQVRLLAGGWRGRWGPPLRQLRLILHAIPATNPLDDRAPHDLEFQSRDVPAGERLRQATSRPSSGDIRRCWWSSMAPPQKKSLDPQIANPASLNFQSFRNGPQRCGCHTADAYFVAAVPPVRTALSTADNSAGTARDASGPAYLQRPVGFDLHCGSSPISPGEAVLVCRLTGPLGQECATKSSARAATFGLNVELFM